jgi:hypothetical protein
MDNMMFVRKKTTLNELYEKFYLFMGRDVERTKMVIQMRETGILSKAEAREMLSLPIFPLSQSNLYFMHKEQEQHDKEDLEKIIKEANLDTKCKP